jgi:hypothetical protein
MRLPLEFLPDCWLPCNLLVVAEAEVAEEVEAVPEVDAMVAEAVPEVDAMVAEAVPAADATTADATTADATTADAMAVDAMAVDATTVDAMAEDAVVPVEAEQVEEAWASSEPSKKIGKRMLYRSI